MQRRLAVLALNVALLAVALDFMPRLLLSALGSHADFYYASVWSMLGLSLFLSGVISMRILAWDAGRRNLMVPALISVALATGIGLVIVVGVNRLRPEILQAPVLVWIVVFGVLLTLVEAVVFRKVARAA